MGGVPPKVGVFFGKADKVSEGWYWTDTSIGQKRMTAITGPFETKERAVENALQSLAARQALTDQPAMNGPSSVSSSEVFTRRPLPLRSRMPGTRLDFWTRVRAECGTLPAMRGHQGGTLRDGTDPAKDRAGNREM
jgi:hypothetical protein